MEIDPQQEIFSALLAGIKELGFDVYDGILPPDGTPYPFVYLGDCLQDEDELKNAVIGNVSIKIHVWHNSTRQRGTVSGMLASIKRLCRTIERTQNFGWMVTNVSQRIIPDNTTKTPLLHGVLDVDFKFS